MPERETRTGQVSAAQRGITTGACRNFIPKHVSCVGIYVHGRAYMLRTQRPDCFWCAASILFQSSSNVPLDIYTYLPVYTWTIAYCIATARLFSLDLRHLFFFFFFPIQKSLPGNHGSSLVVSKL